MSVINQMLKDLDKRGPDTEHKAAPVERVTFAYSPVKIIAITSAVVLLICIIVFYVWQIISENSSLKAEKAAEQSRQTISSPVSNKDDNTVKVQEASPIHSPKRVVLQEESSEIVANHNDKSTDNFPDNNAKKAGVASVSTVQDTSEIASPVVKTKDNTKVTPAKKIAEVEAVDEHSHDGGVTSHSHEAEAKAKLDVKANKMSVSRRQLTPDELAKQKISLAEKALAAKKVSTAEKLFEEAVIIRPHDSQTRQKLAALWYGRKAYNNATNLLSQGIAIDEKNASLRELKARIHLTQRQPTAALNTLKPLADFENEQYQVMLANTAQQLQENDIAAKAYKVLITMQPDKGRWYLGLAVLYDKNSQFSLASAAYKEALTKYDLSVSSEKFIKQRIAAIGQ